MKKEIGHTFLAKLGKKRLRPGGKTATEFLLRYINDINLKVLEVAVNRGINAIDIVKKVNCSIIGVDIDGSVLKIAEENIKRAGLYNKIHLVEASAFSLPFQDNTFDIIMNEALLTMFNQTQKKQALNEYFRVLKPGGLLLVHDIMMKNDNREIHQALTQEMRMNVEPLLLENWNQLFHEIGFQMVDQITGNMTLLSPTGLIKDEGFNLGNVVYNGLKKENRNQFFSMAKTLKKYRNDLGFVASVLKKENFKIFDK